MLKSELVMEAEDFKTRVFERFGKLGLVRIRVLKACQWRVDV